MSWYRTSVLLLSCLMLFVGIVAVESARADAGTETDSPPEIEIESLYDWTGIYVRAGLVSAFPDSHRLRPNYATGLGLSLTGGYRSTAYLAAELDYTSSWAIGSGRDDAKSLKTYEVTFNLKFYPLAILEVPLIPDRVQPYALFGLGWGESQFDDTTSTRLLIRAGIGADILILDQLGVYLEGSYSRRENPVYVRGPEYLDGQGHVRAGLLYRF